MFKKNTAVTGFSIGLVSSTDGSDITTGTPVGYYTLDGGTQTAIGDVTPVHEGNGLWSFDLLASEMNGDIVGLTFTHTSAITKHYTIKTDTKITSELNDIAATAIVSAGAITTLTGAVVNVDLVDTTTTNTDMRGTNSALLAASINLTGGAVDTVTTLTNKTGFELSTAGILAIWHQLVSAVVTTSTMGKLLVDNINATISSRMAESSINTTAGAVDNVTLVATTTTNTDQRGTDSAALASEVTAARMSELDAATSGKMANQVDLIKTDSAAILIDTADMQPKLGTPAADLSADVAAVKVDTAATLVDTAQIGVAGAGLTDLGGMSTGMKGEVNAEADTAITDYDPPTNAEMIARTPSAAQLAYITSNSADGVPVTFSGGTTTTAVLVNVDGSAASSINDFYNGRVLVFNLGTLKNQVTDITAYVGSTKTATITAVTTAVTSLHTANIK